MINSAEKHPNLRWAYCVVCLNRFLKVRFQQGEISQYSVDSSITGGGVLSILLIQRLPRVKLAMASMSLMAASMLTLGTLTYLKVT